MTRSIGERMRHGSATLEKRRATALKWVEDWSREHGLVLRDLDRLARDAPQFRPLLEQMHALNTKRLSALPGVIRALADPDAEVTNDP